MYLLPCMLALLFAFIALVILVLRERDIKIAVYINKGIVFLSLLGGNVSFHSTMCVPSRGDVAMGNVGVTIVKGEIAKQKVKNIYLSDY